jgi:hypothetical protein
MEDAHEKKYCQRETADIHMERKRMADLSLVSASLIKKARSVYPRYKTSQFKINLEAKKNYTQEEVDLIIKRLTSIHQTELDEQYRIFQTIVDDYIMAHAQSPISYIS